MVLVGQAARPCVVHQQCSRKKQFVLPVAGSPVRMQKLPHVLNTYTSTTIILGPFCMADAPSMPHDPGRNCCAYQRPELVVVVGAAHGCPADAVEQLLDLGRHGAPARQVRLHHQPGSAEQG